MIRTLLAPNPSAMTLDGTRTYIVGRRYTAIIDPGPAMQRHLDAIADAVRQSQDADMPEQTAGAAPDAPPAAVILLTHTHPDHAAGADALAGRLDAEVRAVTKGNLSEGDTIGTDAGDITTLLTPGHTPDHASFHLPSSSVVFCGDLMMGGLDTALVAPPEGDLRQYLESLERLRGLAPARILPSHGPPFDEADAAIGRYIEHRMDRCAQVEHALAGARPLSPDEVAGRVYGAEVPEDLREVAVAAVVAYLEYLKEQGRVARARNRWRLLTPSGAPADTPE